MFKAVLVAGLVFIAVGFFGIFLNSDKKEIVASPTKVFGDTLKVKVENSWFPKETLLKAKGSVPVVSASGAILVNYDTGDLLFEKDSNARLPSASTIKIMTALLVLEENKLTDVFNVSQKASHTGEDSMGLTAGEKVTVKELLYGLMLPSGNDAAVTIAENVAGSEDEFVTLMNQRAKALGMKDTKFVNASGLDVDNEEQYSSARDLAVLAHFVWEKFPSFREITATDYIFIDSSQDHKAFELYNDTNLLTTYPGVKGIKPGFTWEAGYCLVTYAENDGKKLIGVLLNSGNRRHEMKDLLDYGFGYYGITVPHPALDL